MINNKQNIRNLSSDDLLLVIETLGEKRFRANQILEWLWKKGVKRFDDMANVSKNIRDALNEKYFIDKINVLLKVSSFDKTTKVLFQSVDDLKFEGVLIPSKTRVTACISTQAGCPLDCKFCATGKLGYYRNLSVGEIFDQVFLLNKLSNEIFNSNLSNIVIMGMGEPLLNYDNTLAAINYMCADFGLAMSPQRITLSTAGIAPMIKQLADDNIKFNLSISLHTASDLKRNAIMPINKKYNLETLSDAIKYFHKKTNKRITYEYLLLKDINDSLEDAKMLTDFTKISPCKINIIEYNSTGIDDFQKPDETKLNDFVKFLETKNLIVNVRKSKGKDINAACGQLANKKQ